MHRIATDPPKKEFPLSKSGAKPPAKPGLIARLLGAPAPKSAARPAPPPRRYDGPAKDASRDVRAQLAAQIKAVRAKLNPQLLRIVEKIARKGPPANDQERAQLAIELFLLQKKDGGDYAAKLKAKLDEQKRRSH
ncbi:hypothetical protein [Ferrovibrio xuzhouensis]|uniref:Uncharacterized protein n=1 Tax=Ferrovibrio xuzhouensis TaxID=1576914 RepID=A0ABV7VFY3_9PROT